MNPFQPYVASLLLYAIVKPSWRSSIFWSGAKLSLKTQILRIRFSWKKSISFTYTARVYSKFNTVTLRSFNKSPISPTVPCLDSTNNHFIRRSSFFIKFLKEVLQCKKTNLKFKPARLKWVFFQCVEEMFDMSSSFISRPYKLWIMVLLICGYRFSSNVFECIELWQTRIFGKFISIRNFKNKFILSSEKYHLFLLFPEVLTRNGNIVQLNAHWLNNK